MAKRGWYRSRHRRSADGLAAKCQSNACGTLNSRTCLRCPKINCLIIKSAPGDSGSVWTFGRQALPCNSTIWESALAADLLKPLILKHLNRNLPRPLSQSTGLACMEFYPLRRSLSLVYAWNCRWLKQ